MINLWRCLTCPSPLSSISLDDMPAPGPPDPSISPVSVLHNSPFYSPVRTAPATARRSPASPAPSAPFMEQVIGNVCSSDDPDDLDSEGQQEAATNDSDEGIESEDGDDIDGEAFKQLIRYLG